MTSEEINQFIRENWKAMSDREMGEPFGISQKAVQQRRFSMGLHKKKGVAKPKDYGKGEQTFEEIGQVEKLKEEVSRLRKMLKEKAKTSAEEAAVAQAIREVVPTRKPVSVPRKVKNNGEKDVESAILMLGDLHYGEVVDESATGGINVYNIDICERRFDYTIEMAVKMAKQKLVSYHIPRLYVFGLGDWISGLIIEDIDRYNEVQVMEQCFGCAEMAERGLLALCQEFEEVVFVGVGGNHARLRPQTYFKMKQVESFDYLIYKLLEQRLKDQPNLKFVIPRAFWSVVDVEGFRFMVTHGDMFKTPSWGGTPYYGLQKDYYRWRSMLEQEGMGFLYMVTGHLHLPTRGLPYGKGEFVINGSLKSGSDEYSLATQRGGTSATQYFIGVHKRFGYTWTFPIKSDHIR